MTKDEALTMALESFEGMNHEDSIFSGEFGEEIAAIKEVLTQPDHIANAGNMVEQEPVVYVHNETGLFRRADRLKGGDFEPRHWTPLYTAPPKRQPLTDKDILADETLRYYFGQNGGAGPVSKQGRKVVDAIEAAHGIGDKT